MEYEGVLVEETTAFHHQAWMQLAEEEGKPAPLQWALKRASGMKAEQVRGPAGLRRLASWVVQLHTGSH